jgi:CubicO group peptidase (beta-lactamase class C family)
VEEALKVSWEQALKSKIGSPLGMTTLGFGPAGAADKATDPWPHLGPKGERQPVAPGPQADNPVAIGPAGRAHCNLADWGKFLQGLLGAQVANGNPLLSEESRRTLFTAPAGREYGMGWIPADEAGFGKGTWMHAGSNTLNYCEAWINPDRGFALLAATNCGDGRNATQEACVEMAKRFKLFA